MNSPPILYRTVTDTIIHFDNFFVCQKVYLGTNFIRQSQETAPDSLGLKLFYPKLNSDVILELKMREMDGYWQIAEINNLSAFMLKLEELEKNKLAELNKPIIDEMNAAVKIESIQVVPVNNGPYSKAVRFPTNITFLSPKDIKEIGMLIEVKNQEGKILFKNIMQSAGSTYPGKVSTINWGKEKNPFIKSDADLFNTPVNKLTVQIQP